MKPKMQKTRLYIGKHLREMRKQHGLLQKTIADYLGISVAVYSNFEKDNAEPSLSIVIGLAEFYETTTDNILNV